MKKYFSTISAIVISIMLLAFTTHKSKTFTTYWFGAECNGTAICWTIEPPTFNPFSCSGGTCYCAVAYSAYTYSNGMYCPAGSLLQAAFKN